MEKAFRASCVVLTLIAVGAWALLLHQAKEPWKLIGVNEMSPANDQEGPGHAKQGGKQIAISSSKSHVMPPGEGDRTVDTLLGQRPHPKQDPFDLHDARLLFTGPGPVAPKPKHHRKKPKDADSSSEEKETDDTAASSENSSATNTALPEQTLIVANAWPSTAALPSNVGSIVTSPVMKTTQTVVERISAPIRTTVNELTQGITNVTQPHLQGLINTAPSTVSQTTSSLTSPLQTLTSQTIHTLSSPTSSIPSVTSPISAVASTVASGGISSTSSTPTISTVSTPTMIATVTTAPPPASVPNFGPAATGAISNISSSFPTSGPTSVSSGLLAPTTGIPKAGGRGR